MKCAIQIIITQQEEALSWLTVSTIHFGDVYINPLRNVGQVLEKLMLIPWNWEKTQYLWHHFPKETMDFPWVARGFSTSMLVYPSIQQPNGSSMPAAPFPAGVPSLMGYVISGRFHEAVMETFQLTWLARLG